MKHILIALLFFTPLYSSAQSIISGSVSSESNSVEGVIVRLQIGGKDVSYDITDEGGLFELKFTSREGDVKAIFSHLSYELKEIALENKTQRLDITLTPKVTEIKEITVSAPDIRLRGDTLVYALGAFTGLSNVTLEDALKRLPGVEVAQSGKISYMGKNISNFYIEGMDLLGGRYSIATTNITPDMVSTVEVIENHQPIKMMQGKMLSDAVAMNIKLKKEAKLKPSGTIEGTLGYIEDELLYRLGLTGMLFSKEFQTISTIKYGNVGKQNSSEAAIHFYETKGGDNLAMDVLSSLSGTTPPLSDSRYLNREDGLVSINTINKLSDDDELRINANYTYTNEDYAYSLLSDYYVEGENTLVEEVTSPLSIVHSPSLEFRYNKNSKELYINNTLKGSLSILDERFPTLSGDEIIGQEREALDYGITNNFSLRKPVGTNFIGFSSVISYLATPDNSVSYSSALDDSYNYIQNADGNTFYTSNKLDYSFNAGRYTRLFLPLNLDYSYDRVNTMLSGRDTEPNDLRGGNLRTTLSPRMEYKAPSGRFEMTLSAPVGYSLLDYNQATDKYSTLLYSPSVSMKFTLSPSSLVQLNAGASNSIGDATSFLVNPIQTSYRSATIASGIISESEQQSATLRYQYKLPLSYFFINASLGYSHTCRNQLSSQYFVDEDIITSTVLGDNQSEGFNAALSFTKLFKSIDTKVDLSGVYRTSSGEVIQQEVLTSYTSSYYGASLNVKTNPTKWMEFSYNGTVALNNSKYLEVSSSVISHSHRAQLSFEAFKKLKLFVRGDYVNNQISTTDYVDMLLLDFGATYKFEKFELDLSINNILDTRAYAYTIFSSLDTYTYNYTLRGREITLSFRLL